MILQRRTFLTGLASLFAAPAIVRAESLMPVKLVDFSPPPAPGFVFQALDTVTGKWVDLERVLAPKAGFFDVTGDLGRAQMKSGAFSAQRNRILASSNAIGYLDGAIGSGSRHIFADNKPREHAFLFRGLAVVTS
jgi:hypothetical protein